MIHVDTKLCEVCGTCAGVCSVDAVTIERSRILIDRDLCVLCFACVSVCPVGAVKKIQETQNSDAFVKIEGVNQQTGR